MDFLGLACVTLLDKGTDPVHAGSKYCFPVCLTVCLSSAAAGEKSAKNLVKNPNVNIFGEADVLVYNV